MERIFAVPFWIIDNNITSEGTALFIHEMGRNHSHSPSTLLSQAPICKAERQHLSYTFCKARAVFPKYGGHNTSARDRGCITKQVPPHQLPKALVSLSWAPEHSTENIKRTWELAPSSSSSSQPQQLECSIWGRGSISQMLRKSHLTQGPISWLCAGLFTPLVLEKEVTQPVLMYTFSSSAKPPVVGKRSRAVRSGVGFLSESQAGCRICSCSLAWQRANSNTAALICFSVSWTFVCHFPIQHHTSLNQRLKFPRLSTVMAWTAVLFRAIFCRPTDPGIQIRAPVQQLLSDLFHSSLPWPVHVPS